jgi:hypothetical protein
LLLVVALAPVWALAGPQGNDQDNPAQMNKKQLEERPRNWRLKARRSLQKTVADQRRALEGLTFKAIPARPVQLSYRDHL